MKYKLKKWNPGKEFDHYKFKLGEKGFGFIGKKKGSVGLERCPKCERENYAMTVMSGTCAWCGFDVKPIVIDIATRSVGTKAEPSSQWKEEEGKCQQKK